MEQSKNKNAGDMKQITDVTKEEEQERKRASKSSNPLKTGFERCTMQITIAIMVQRMEQGKSENADDMKQMTDVTKQNKRRKRIYLQQEKGLMH
ncbi:hypothetical protein T4E_5048 [Trichinella pseudospiralis]|uniref:Uncharacterized protein n=1 Tax=Trichinella pseudospiralis TaxID=6337 RepID=A0A0V0Y4V3_TRIPS|nr:hypothetical protein T4E_531 [Trichinella pseudospiralis]KRX95024.1 hypothetical protein T4E_5048 [Trichinella pseudospiralis]